MAKGIKTGGRKAGTPNKATAEVKELASKFAPAAIVELARLATEAESEAARVAAANSILDRAYGKPAQAMDVTSGGEKLGWDSVFVAMRKADG